MIRTCRHQSEEIVVLRNNDQIVFSCVGELSAVVSAKILRAWSGNDIYIPLP